MSRKILTLEEKNLQDLPQRLRILLAERDLRQTDLAEKIGVKESLVSYWMNGKRAPNIERLQQIADVLNVSLDDLFREPIEHLKPAGHKLTREIQDDDYLSLAMTYIDQVSVWNRTQAGEIKSLLITMFYHPPEIKRIELLNRDLKLILAAKCKEDNQSHGPPE